MDRRTFARKGLALMPVASILLATAGTDAGKKKRKPRPRPRPRPKPRPTPPTPPTPPMVKTQTFTNRAPINLPSHGPANPYPAKILVNGLANARILDVNLILHEFWHIRPFDAAVMLVSPSGTGAAMMHNVGGNHPVSAVVITLDDQATESMSNSPDGVIKTGTYKPTAFQSISNLFPAPAPQGVTETALATFNGEDPNGEWKLFVIDDTSLYSGLFNTGWSLVLTYEIPAPQEPDSPQPPSPPKKRRRRKKRKPRRVAAVVSHPSRP